MFKVPMLPRSLEALCRDLADPNVRVRLSAIQESARHTSGEGRERVVSLLIQALTHGDPALRVPTLVALADSQATEAISVVAPLLVDGDPETRRATILALGELAPSGDQEILSKIAPFLQAADPRIRYQAVVATAAILGALAVDSLRTAAEDPDPLIRELVARLLDDLIAADPSLIDRARETLGGLARDPTLSVRAIAQLSCHEHGVDAPSDGVFALAEGSLRGREPRDEQIAIELGGRLRLSGLVRALERRAFGFLGFSSDPLRFHAKAALAALGHATARRSVERGLRRGSRVERAALASALAGARATEFESAIRGMLNDPELRPIAEQALFTLSGDSP